MAELAVTSRYNYAVLYADKETGGFFGTRQPINLKKHSSDLFFQVTDATNKRLDLIAWKYYKDVNLWWVIAEINNISNPFEVKTGAVLRIPTYERVQMEVIQ